MLKLNTVMLNSEQPDKLSEFYTAVLGEPGWSDGGFTGFDAGGTNVMVGPHDKIHGQNQEAARIILNFETEDVAGEYQRILGIGATSVAEPYNPDKGNAEIWLATLADPDGNYIQLASPWAA